MTPTAAVERLSPAPVSSDDLARRAESLIPVLSARAADTEARRQLPPETMADLHRLGLIKYFQPRCYGGFELEWGTQTKIGRALARGCASTSWIATVVGSHSAYVARMPPKAQEDVWGENQDVLISTGAMGRGISVRRVDGGFVVNGRWSFCSGADHANWALTRGGPDNEAVSEQLYFLYPKSEFTVEDDWFVTGMRGTGSKTIVVKELFVPQHRTLRMADLMAPNPPGSAVSRSYVASYNFRAFAGTALIGPILGCAEAAVADYVAEIKSDPVRAADLNEPLRLSEAMAEVGAAALLVESVIAQAHTAGSRNEVIPREGRIASLRDRTFAARLCMSAVDRIATAQAAAGIFAETPFQRRYRDLSGLLQQIGVNWDRNMSNCARAELGLKSDIPFFNAD